MSLHLLELLNGEKADSDTPAHFAELIRASVENKSELRGLSHIQIYSYFLRKNKFAFQQHLEGSKLCEKINKDKQYQAYLTSVAELTANIGKIDNKKPIVRSDLLQEQAVFRTAGVSVGETNTYHLSKVIKILANEHQTKSIRFWGKILGYKDYFIIQGVSSKVYLSQQSESEQKYGSGVNTYSYWAATDILGRWTELPLVSPSQLTGSRTFKYIFTGNLEAAVSKSTFQAQEKHLLKCIVARITHSCELAPKGLFKISEENPTQIDYEDEFKTPEVNEMGVLQNWVHVNPNILQQGRCSYFVDPRLSEEQKEALSAELAEKDPIVQRLKGVSEDKPYDALGYTANWTIAIAGETTSINQIGKQEGTSLLYGVAVLRNLVWPGAVTIGFRGGWSNIYIGYGHRISQEYSAIRVLKELQTEADERIQRAEPNPSKPPEQKKQQPIPSQ